VKIGVLHNVVHVTVRDAIVIVTIIIINIYARRDQQGCKVHKEFKEILEQQGLKEVKE